jgi:hypothetical protein
MFAISSTHCTIHCTAYPELYHKKRPTGYRHDSEPDWSLELRQFHMKISYFFILSIHTVSLYIIQLLLLI